MSELDRPGLRRIKELYEQGLIQREIAEDPELRRTMLVGIDKASSRRWKVFHTINAMADMGIIEKREPGNMRAPSVGEIAHDEALSQKTKSFYDKHLEDYETLLGAASKRRSYKPRSLRGRTETVVLSDTHIPDERMDFLTEIALRHKGAACVLAGDINDFERFGRFDLKDWTAPDLHGSLARTDVVLGFLTDHFTHVDVLWGNHDLRLPRKAAKQLGPDYYFVCQQFLMNAYAVRHGVKVVQQKITKDNGRELPPMYFYQQIGDCLIGHVEAAGAPVGKGVELAHDFFFSRSAFLGLDPFKVVLQAHTHKQCYFRHKLTGAHLFEIGCCCDEQAYSMSQPKYGPVQQGYFHLVQYDGVTDINESRLYTFS
jgi:predicted phosphodiesterase